MTDPREHGEFSCGKHDGVFVVVCLFGLVIFCVIISLCDCGSVFWCFLNHGDQLGFAIRKTSRELRCDLGARPEIHVCRECSCTIYTFRVPVISGKRQLL